MMSELVAAFLRLSRFGRRNSILINLRIFLIKRNRIIQSSSFVGINLKMADSFENETKILLEICRNGKWDTVSERGVSGTPS